MANQEHLKILAEGSVTWNLWRDQHPSLCPDLSRANLTAANLENANLSNVDLRWSILEQANLRKANLEKAALQHANLDKAILYKASLLEASLRGASLRKTNLHKASLEHANLEQVNLCSATLNYANLRRANLTSSNLMNATLTCADLRRCQLLDANLRHANFHEADLRHASLRGAKLDRAVLHAALLTRADLRETSLQQADLSKANLQQALLQHAILDSADLCLADLWQANLEESQAQRTIFTKASLQETRLCRATLEEAKLDHANLSAANLAHTNLTRADLTETLLVHCTLSKASLRETTLVGTVADGANMRHAILSGTLLDRASFLRADLTDATFEEVPDTHRTTISNTSFGMANLTGVQLPSELTTFREALRNVERTSRHARGLHLWLVGLCLFSLLTMAVSTGSDHLPTSAMLHLPLFNAQVPTLLFFLGVPSLAIILFLYFHFYLAHLYQSISSLPAHFPDGLSLKEKLYPWMVNLCMHEWQLQSVHRIDSIDWPVIKLIKRELLKPSAWSKKMTLVAEILQFDDRFTRWATQCRTGIVVLVGWGLTPLTIGVLTYPWLAGGSSNIGYLLLGFFIMSALVCSLSFETARHAMRAVKDNQRWVRPVILTGFLVISVLLMASQHPAGLDQSASMAHHYDSEQHLLP